MRYLDLVLANPLVWGLFLAYLAGTSWLAWLGHKRTRKDISSFAVGDGDLHPVIVGVTLAAAIASTATFVINPGFVFVHGLSAFMHYGVAAGTGIVLGLVLMSTGFRKVGEKHKAITLPQWIGQRYGSRALTVIFAAINLLSVLFVVLIVGGVSIVMQQTLGLTNVESLVLVIGFVFGYVFIGGTYAHAYTNTLQGAIMLVISVLIVGSGFHLFAEGPGAFLDKVAVQDSNLVHLVNPESALFGSFFSVYVSGFLIGFALVCQPHIMTKALYVKSDRAVRQYLAVTIGVSVVFTGLLLVGLYARVAQIPITAFFDPATMEFRQDLVMTAYLVETFHPALLAVVAVSLLAAGMSTLDGILVALSTIAANDLVRNLTEGNLLRGMGPETRARTVHRMSQGILIALGLTAFVLALNPPRLLGIFGQVGVYGIVAASTVPVLFGILFPRAGRGTAFAATFAGLAVHFGLYGLTAAAARYDVDPRLFGRSFPELGFQNPAVTATFGLIASLLAAGPALLADTLRQRVTSATAVDSPPVTSA